MLLARTAVAAALFLSLAGCFDSPVTRTVGGALAGSVVADATGGSRTRGALIGAVAGGVSCGVPGLPPCRSGY